MHINTPMRVLIVDDSREDRAHAEAALLSGSRRKFTFLEAESGADAVAQCAQDPSPECVLLDHHLPDMDAIEVLDRLRAGGARLPTVPVVIITGSEQNDVGRKVSHAGAMGFIGKDWMTPNSLTRVVDAAIQRHALFEQQERAAIQARERESKLQLALQAGHAGTFHHDLASNVVTWSPELEQIVGYEPGTFGGQLVDFRRHIHPEDLELTLATIESAIARCADYDFEFRVVRVDGTIRWLAGRGRAFAQYGERADTITGVAFDITDRKRAEAELRSREQQLSLAQEAGGLGLWDWDIVNDRAVWSERAWRQFEPGAEGGVITYERWLSRLHPEDRKSAADAVGRAMAGATYRDEFRVVHPDGSTKWLEAIGEVIRGADDVPHRMIGFVRDVTERKAAEAVLRESEARFRLMSETIPQIVYTCGPDGRYVWVNRHWHTYTGCAKFSELQWLENLHPDDRQRVGQLWINAIQSGKEFADEYRVRRADGSYGWQLSRAVPVRNETGAVVQWVGTSNDIDTMRNEALLREQLMSGERAARAQAEVANHLKDEFLATLSHELRTPLSNVLAWARILQKKSAVLDDQLKRGLAIIVDNAKAQTKIISDMLDTSRIVRGKVTLDIRPLPLREFVEQCCASHRPTAEARNLTIVCDVTLPEGAAVLADRGRLQQVLGNLLTNAIKFTRSGGSIIIGARRSRDWYELLVSDTGEGISAEALPHVFDRFRQGGGGVSHRESGLGLGLAIVKQLTELHGGHVTVASDGVGHGATFIVRLPATVVVSEPLTPQEESGAYTDAESEPLKPDALRNVDVWIVDDESEILEYTCSILSDHGARVRGFASGHAALGALRADRSAQVVLVTDLGMAGMDGVTLVRAIRTDLGLGPERIPALAATAFAREEDRELAFSAGFQSYLTKPYDAGQLIACVRQLAREREQSQVIE